MQLQPSSLVFMAIVLGWAGYLVPAWVRRRETLGESRDGDRDSSGLRLLSRPHRAGGGPSTSPLLPDPRALGDPDVDPLAPGTRPPDGAPPPGVPVRRRPSPGALAAQRRARVLAVLLLLTGTAWLLALVVPAVSALGWLTSFLLVLDVVALVVAGRRRAVRRARAERERLRRRQEALRARRRREDAQARAVVAPKAEPPRAPAVEPPAPEAPPARPERASERVSRQLDEGPSGESWTPVPVPPPTYTLKQTAPRPEPAAPAPAAPPATTTAEASDAPAGAPEEAAPGAAEAGPVEEPTFADGLDLDEVLARRRAVNG